ncbi:MAG: amino acid ABC transporter permease, partial [Acidimicrobiales bacterium]
MSDSASRRALHERARRRRSLLVAALSSAAVIVAVVLLVPRMPRWDRVRASFFDGERFRDSLPRLREAVWLDVRIFLWWVRFIVLIAVLVAVSRYSRSPV